MTVTDTRSALAANSAREHLLRLDRLRLIDRAQNEGFTLRQIADLLEISATQVHRLAQRVLQQPGELERTPQEVIYQRSAGVITDDEMMDTLVHWDYTYGYVPTEGDQQVDAYAKGSWMRCGGRIGGVCSPTTSGTSCSRAPAPHGRRSALRPGGERGGRTTARGSVSAIGAPGSTRAAAAPGQWPEHPRPVRE